MKAVPGIYCCICLLTGKRYVGSSNNMLSRTLSHKKSLLKNQHSNKYLQSAWNKYGQGNFTWEVLEECVPEIRLVEREQFWIDHFDSSRTSKGYNLSYPVRQRTPNARMSEVFKQWWASLSEEEKSERNLKVSVTMLEMCSTPEHRKHLSKVSGDYWRKESSRKKQSVKQLAAWQNPDIRARRSKKSVPTKLHKLFLKIGDTEKPVKIWAMEAGIPYGLLKSRFNKDEPVETMFRPSYKTTRGHKCTQEFTNWLNATLYGGAAAATGLGIL